MPEFWETSDVVENSPQQPNWWESGTLVEQPSENPAKAFEDSSKIYDIALESEIPLNEAERLYAETETPTPSGVPYTPSTAERFGRQFYNTAIGNVVTAIGSQSEFGQLKTDVKTSEYLRNEFRRKIENGEPVTEREIEYYQKPYRKGTIGSLFGIKPEPWLAKAIQDHKDGKLPIRAPESPQEAMQKFIQTSQAAKQEVFEKSDATLFVPEPQNAPDKILDAAAGIAGFMAQVAVLKKSAPSMPDFLVWENINLASGGKPGHGAAMQLTMGGLNQVIPGTGFIPAVERGSVAAGFFGTTTYLGGGDTVDVLISMGIPYAFEGMGVTKQAWVNYKNKKQMIQTIRQKAPSLADTPDVVIEKAVGDVLSNIKYKTAEQMKSGLAPKQKAAEISAEVKQYMQRKRYDELLSKANAGDKKAVRELNDYMQGKNVPTYEQLLEKAFNGDASAVERIQIGEYQGGTAGTPQLEIPKTKLAGVEYKPRTPIQKIRDNEPIMKNDMKPVTEKINPKDAQKARERGFITSVKEIKPELKVKGQYIPRSTDTLSIKARNLIKDNIVKAEQIAAQGSDDKAIAVIAELIKHYTTEGAKAKNAASKSANFDKAAQIANDAAVRLTELGRAVQAASILARLTPEGQVRFAAREIQKYNEKVENKKAGRFSKKIPELTGEQAEYIMKEMAEINKIPEGKQKYIRFQKLQDYVRELVPTPMFKKIITTWKAGLLTGVKTSGLNIFSNASHAVTETVKDIPAAAVDKVVSYFTGKRTVTPTIRGAGKGSIEGLGKGLEYLKSGYSERDIGTKLDYTKVSWDKNSPTQRALQKYTDTVFRVLGAEDQPFYYAAKLRSMYEQAKVSAINLKLKGKAAQDHINGLMADPTERMVALSSKDAETAVFINNTKLGDIAAGIQRLPGGEIVVPFGRTPSAVAMQIVNYSPVGIAKTITDSIGRGRFDQRSFSQGLGRGLTGTAVLFIGTELFKAGMVTLDYPTDEKERKLWELEGRQPNSVKIGDDWRTVQSFGPAGNLLIVGGHFQRAFDENGSPTGAMAEALSGSAKSFTEQTFLRGVNQVVDALADPERSATTVFGNTLASIVPTIVSDVARATDTQDRRAESTPEKIMAKIPGARQTLEPKVTAFGDIKEPSTNPIELMIDPTRPSKDISTPVVQELRRLWDEGWEVAPGQLGDKTGYDVLTQQENTELWKRSGTLVKNGLTQLIENPLYNQLPDDKKAELIGTIITETQSAAKAEMVVKKIAGLEGEELTTLMFDLRKSGLATTDIVPIQLSKRNPRKAQRED